jgi:hypothetical protein
MFEVLKEARKKMKEGKMSFDAYMELRREVWGKWKVEVERAIK